MTKQSKKLLKDILISGTSEEKKTLLSFKEEDSRNKVLQKFKLYSRSCFPRYFKEASAPFHDDIILDYISAYRGEDNILVAAFRDAAKTSLLKLFIAFVVQNDLDVTHKYIKVLSKDILNSKQIITDVYNMLVETTYIYGDLFEKEGDKKREETMRGFTMKKGVKVSAGSVGQDQRGHLQDAYRPSLLLFEDIEDRTSISSQVQTQGIINRCQEAIDGMAKEGRFVVNCNYLSENGTIQWFMDKPSVRSRVVPIATGVEYERDETGKKVLAKAIPTWPRFSIYDLREKYLDSEDWLGEFMCDPGQSEDKFFDIPFIDRHVTLFAKEPDRISAGVRYWGKYDARHRYGQGSDHSEGIGRDSNTLAGFDFTTGEVIYTYANNNIPPDGAAAEFARVGAEFGHCIYAPESNNKCGGIVVTTLKNIDYPSLYRFQIKDKLNNVITNKLGWETNSKTKNTMFMEFRRDFEDGLITIYDIDLLKEMRSYTNSDLQDKTTGLITRHFDLLTAAVIAWQMRDHAAHKRDVRDFYDQLSSKNHAKARR